MLTHLTPDREFRSPSDSHDSRRQFIINDLGFISKDQSHDVGIMAKI